jgi:hemoglobin
VAVGDSAYDRLGGEQALRSIIDDFIDRVFADVMIGFFFRDANRARVKDKEFELAANLLGGPFEYTGEPLRRAHAAHPIMGGHFARRSQILRETLAAHGVPADIVAVWLEHTETLRDQVTSQPDGECID